MNRILIAYNTAELEKTTVLSEAKNLYKSNLLDEDQWNGIRKDYTSQLYTPSIFMRIVLFIFSVIGMSTAIGPFGLIISGMEIVGYRILSFILGLLILIITERWLIKEKKHYRSGITEAGIFSGLSFIAFSILGSGPETIILYPIVGALLALFAAIRYLNIFSLVLALFFISWILFQLITEIGGIIEALMPLLFMTFFAILYWNSSLLERKLSNVIFDTQFVILKTISLLMFYIAGNYFVVRELSITLMGFDLANHEDIPFAFIFYTLTALVPIAYLYWGIKKKSILFIRIGLLTFGLSVITFKYYFSLGYPVATITISGGLLIAISLALLTYLKKIRNGFTRELIMQEKLGSKDLAAIIASQTLGGNQPTGTTNDEIIFKGGKFGGGGASSSW
jgi:hypothetical protein